MTEAHEGSDIAADDKLRALDVVLHSEIFARADRLKSLLRFICEAEIHGRLSVLNEYTIATEALGRPENFSPAEDSSVRTRIYELRQKLDKLYRDEAAHAPVHIELPRGAYVPQFVRVKDSSAGTTLSSETGGIPPPVLSPALSGTLAAIPGAESAPPRPVPNVSKPGPRVLAISFAAGAALMFLAVTFAARYGFSPRTQADRLWTPELTAIWKPFLDTSVPTIIAYDSPFFVRMGPLSVRDWHANSMGEVTNSEPLQDLKKLFGLQQLYENRYYADRGTPRAVFYLTRLLSTRNQNLIVTPSTELSSDDYAHDNLILMGKPSMNPAVERELARTEFIMEGGRIRNLHPRAGEEPEYRDQGDWIEGRWGQKYALITALAGQMEGKHVFYLMGSGSEHPSGLAYYLTSPERARELYSRMRSLSGGVPQQFQVVIQIEFRGFVPTKTRTVAFRDLSKLKK